MLDDPRVGVVGSGPDVGPLAGQPCLDEEPAERGWRSTRLGVGALGLQASGEVLGFRPVAAEPPTAPLPSGDRIDAVVVDDVEAVLALHDVGHVAVIDDEGADPTRLSA